MRHLIAYTAGVITYVCFALVIERYTGVRLIP